MEGKKDIAFVTGNVISFKSKQSKKAEEFVAIIGDTAKKYNFIRKDIDCMIYF